MDPALAFLLIVFGIPLAVWPYRVALFGEQTDSIGSKRSWSEVEPTESKVKLTRILGVVMTVVGVVLLLTI